MLPRAGAIKKEMGDVVFQHYHQAMKGISLVNTGSQLEIVLSPWSKEAVPSISGADLPGDFILHKTVIHWGTGLNEGSEHIVETTKYAGEVLWSLHYK